LNGVEPRVDVVCTRRYDSAHRAEQGRIVSELAHAAHDSHVGPGGLVGKDSGHLLGNPSATGNLAAVEAHYFAVLGERRRECSCVAASPNLCQLHSPRGGRRAVSPLIRAHLSRTAAAAGPQAMPDAEYLGR